MKFTAEIESFIKDFVSDLLEGNVAIFAGAGMSKAVGYVDWQELLSDIADELGLKSHIEHDLISLAQFHVNERGGKAGVINKKGNGMLGIYIHGMQNQQNQTSVELTTTLTIYQWREGMSNKPIETFRSGTVRATIWANAGEDNQIFHTAAVTRSYKDGNGEWKETNTFLAHHLADLNLVSNEAFRFLRMGLRTPHREENANDAASENGASSDAVSPAADDEAKTFTAKESQRRGTSKNR